ncbi:MAG: hypothetical protein ACJAS1_007070, partial [Oleiphilaceae bacterium]
MGISLLSCSCDTSWVVAIKFLGVGFWLFSIVFGFFIKRLYAVVIVFY